MANVTYADVILPLAIPRAYTYAIPFDLVEFVQIGHRVIVQFGKNRFYSAIVQRIHHQKPPVEPKLIDSIADEAPIVTNMQLQFWEWMAAYYMCNIGDVMNAALPAALKLSSETKIRFNEYYDGDFENLTDEEFLVVQALRNQQEMKLPDVQQLLKKKNVYPVLKTLFNCGIAISSEEIVGRYKARTETYVKLHDRYNDSEKLELLFDELTRAPRQVELLLAYTQLGHKTKYIRKNELLSLSKVTAGVLKALVEKGVFVEFKMEVSRLGNLQDTDVQETTLSEYQQQALGQLQQQLQEHRVVLMHGVTGSGKTNLYIEQIKAVLENGRQVLYILPEIALTAQIINRIRKVFGNRAGIYHSKFNHNERVEIWNKVLRNEYRIIIAARSGLFLPFKDLGLLIVDEEHDNSLKQADPAPRYHARDAGIMLAHMFEAKVILGTATPAVETAYNAEKNKYGLVKLTKRFGDLEMPEMIIANIREHQRRQKLQGSFTSLLTDHIHEALKRKEQVILFINRRGFANYQMCRTCSHVYRCKNCDVSLTYHKFQGKLICHYCGYYEKVHDKCIACGAVDLDIVGMGTEKIEDEICELFPAAKVARLDYDATKTKHGHAEVLSKFENREVDILVGTQMVTKGLDFDHVSLVGIMNADQLIHHPGFRSHERAFQLITQVAGRAGRKHKKGEVIIQCSDYQHPVIQYALQHDYQKMYEHELAARRQFQYPPYSRMIEFTLKHKQVKTVEQAALFMANEFRRLNLCKVLGPSIPPISKVNNYYIREILVKATRPDVPLHTLKAHLQKVIDTMKTLQDIKTTDIYVDVDP